MCSCKQAYVCVWWFLVFVCLCVSILIWYKCAYKSRCNYVCACKSLCNITVYVRSKVHFTLYQLTVFNLIYNLLHCRHYITFTMEWHGYPAVRSSRIKLFGRFFGWWEVHCLLGCFILQIIYDIFYDTEVSLFISASSQLLTKVSRRCTSLTSFLIRQINA